MVNYIECRLKYTRSADTYVPVYASLIVLFMTCFQFGYTFQYITSRILKFESIDDRAFDS